MAKGQPVAAVVHKQAVQGAAEPVPAHYTLVAVVGGAVVVAAVEGYSLEVHM